MDAADLTELASLQAQTTPALAPLLQARALQESLDVHQCAQQLQELRGLKADVPNPEVLGLINIRMRALQKQLDRLMAAKQQAQAAPAPLAKKPAVVEPAPPKFEEIKKYAWDQSTKQVTVYLSLAEVGQCHCDFQTTSLLFTCVDKSGKSLRLRIPTLCEPIDTAQSTYVVKPERVVLKLRKHANVEWTGLDDTEKRKKAQHQKLASSGASTAELLANMYNNADDKTREELSQAALQGRIKREEENKKKLG
eukprot:NODE_3599_length_937_cov_41.467901_g3447_i0.p1 GENE.NODE_3599_length_937_cov_41.467901_g3447_i0~~NODE_3599_length_937_cov_41.467901_g3447_i0.p1  ORF type:complete len:271 (-),score=102.23 NODE_3599_length_937_cov_41.467901_g3447_i0:125-880(-)